jgi:hypothetical protein
MPGKISMLVAVTAMLMVLSTPADARFGGGGCRAFHRQVRVVFGQRLYGARFCGGVYYGACWRWQFTPWGWRLIKVCGGWFGEPDIIRLP